MKRNTVLLFAVLFASLVAIAACGSSSSSPSSNGGPPVVNPDVTGVSGNTITRCSDANTATILDVTNLSSKNVLFHFDTVHGTFPINANQKYLLLANGDDEKIIVNVCSSFNYSIEYQGNGASNSGTCILTAGQSYHMKIYDSTVFPGTPDWRP